MAFCLSFQLYRREMYVALLCTFYSRHESHWHLHAGTFGNLSWSFLGWKWRFIQWLKCYLGFGRSCLRSFHSISALFFSNSYSLWQRWQYFTQHNEWHMTWRSAKEKTANERKLYKNYCSYLNPSNNLWDFLLLRINHTEHQQNCRSEQKYYFKNTVITTVSTFVKLF